MTQTQPRLDVLAHQSMTDGEIVVAGLSRPLTIRRDCFGVPHIRAESEHDAWFGQGFAAAQDRLWQMEYDRRRATGRWAEVAGSVGVPGDVLARRLQLERAGRADVEVMSSETRAMFDAYAAGINAFLKSGQPLPVEYELTGITPEPWETWHSPAIFKIRHVLMGVWQLKVTQAGLLAMIGHEAYERLDLRPPLGSKVILPPGGAYTALYQQAAEEIAAAAEQLGFLAEVQAGSNSWAVHGSRTTTGMPVLCNDSHRALDVPSVYWQVHVACPEFDVIGATFPGLPGFPHFGHNGHVGWNITHTSADYQDLYIEQFDPEDPTRYRTPDGWSKAEHAAETIAVRGGESITIETWRTRHGPIVHGDPRSGMALSLRYTATDEPCRGFEPLRPMLRARNVAELHASQREWVDPVNNLVSADTDGNIGYLTRGYLPVRSSQAHRQFPAPGWTGEHAWTGRVPFEELPRAINPPEGFIGTANQAVIPGDDPYISHQFAPPSRAQRIVELLTAKDRLGPDEIMAMQGDTTSVPARNWSSLLSRVGPFEGEAERARLLLADGMRDPGRGTRAPTETAAGSSTASSPANTDGNGWDGNLLPESGEALLYAYFRRAVARALFEPIIGALAWAWLTSEELPALGRMIGQWLANIVAGLEGSYADATPDGRFWNDLLPGVLAAAWIAAVAKAGPDPLAWRWGDHHFTHAKHTLAATFPDDVSVLNPPRVSVGGDSDTLQCAAYGWSSRADFDINALSVYRQAVDFMEIDTATFVVPGGVSGLPRMPHYADQLELWRIHQRIPMHYKEGDVQQAAEQTLRLTAQA
ncbi:MAG: penicillin acylase family protein [Dehalococcoidia bacterium]